MNERNGRGIFYGVVGVATLVVAIVGATLAYFSVQALGRNNVTASSKYVSLTLLDGPTVSATNLIPINADAESGTAGSTDLVYDSYLSNGYKTGTSNAIDQCRDSNGEQVCVVYSFTVSSEGGEQEVTAKLRIDTNQFNDSTLQTVGNLKYRVYERTGITTPAVDNLPTAILGTSTELPTVPNDPGYIDVTLFENQTIGTTAKTYDLLIWLNDIGEDQPKDQGKSFQGKVYVTVNGANANGQITGNINTVTTP